MKFGINTTLMLSAMVLVKEVGGTNSVLRINCGHEFNVTDNDGNNWIGDQDFVYGDNGKQSYCFTSPPTEISNTDLDIIYCDRRIFLSDGGGGYQIPVDAGVYNVKLMFAELETVAPNVSAVFDVLIQDQVVTADLDVLKKYGFLKAGRIQKQVTVSTLPNEKGMIDIWLRAGLYAPFLNGIVIERIRDAPIYVPVPYRMNAGYTKEAIMDRFGSQWSPDKYFKGGNKFGYSTCENMVDPKLYCTERNARSFSYKIPIQPRRDYNVRLHFAEFFHNTVGKRVFNVTVQGIQRVVDLDLIATAGSREPYIVRVDEIYVEESNPWITIELKSSVDTAKISGIYIRRYEGGGRL